MLLCHPEATEEAKLNIAMVMCRLKVFVYLTEREENEMGFKPREFRPLAEHPNHKDSVYLGQWRIGSNVTEGRGVIIFRNGCIHEGYSKNNETTGYGRSIWPEK